MARLPVIEWVTVTASLSVSVRVFLPQQRLQGVEAVGVEGEAGGEAGEQQGEVVRAS